jgi:hypothetical protein
MRIVRGSMGGDVESKRSAGQEAHRESLDAAFWLRPEQLTRPTSRAGMEATRSEEGVFAPAQRVGEILHAVASALREIPFGDVHGIEIRRLTDLTVEQDASLEFPIEVRTRGVDTRELTAGRQLVVIHCQLTDQFGDCVAAFSVEIEAQAEVPAASTGLDGTTDSAATPEPDLECVDNIPV